ncbi:hypothetical protein BH10CYA1_BH10CYA1_34350 [soil metagenome]
MTERRDFEIAAKYDFVVGPARLYRADNDAHVIISDALASEYDKLRDSYAPKVVQDLSQRITPENVFAAINTLPNPELVREVILQDHFPDEEESATILGTPTATAFDSGRLVLPAALPLKQLPEALLLGWTRLMWLTYEVQTHFFKHAAFLEADQYCIDDSFEINEFENWALHMVRGILYASNHQFETFISKAPLRAVTLASALQRTLDDYQNHISNQIDERIDAVARITIAKAQEKLLDLVAGAVTDHETVQTAFKLLLLLGTESQLKSLKLTTIDLSNEPHNNLLLAKLANIPSIERLNLSQSMLSREGTEFLQELINLRMLDLSYTRIMSSSLEPLGDLTSLEELDLSGTLVNDSAMTTLPKIKSLKRLDVTDTDITSVKDLRGCMPDCVVDG